MTTPLFRAVARTGFAAALLVAPLVGCGSDDDDAADSTTTEAAADESTTTEAADGSTTEPEAEGDETTTTEATEGESGEIGTSELLDHLNETAPEIGALFDWNTGDGVIGVNYMGVQTVGLYAATIDAETAVAACEAASDFVFGLDPEAAIEVFTGGYGTGTVVASRTGEAGTCAAV
jgi:hypothetical protein